MKNYLLKTLLVFLGASGIIQAQTAITGTVLQQPCNNNGQLAVSVTGLTPPITYNYNFGLQSVTHAGVNSTSDIITNLPAYMYWSNVMYVSVSATDANGFAGATFTLSLPFTYSLTTTPAVCPALGSMQATINGGTAPYTYLWTNQSTMQTYNTNPMQGPAGAYSVAVTDAAGCVVYTDSMGIANNSPVNVNIATTAANCTNGTAAAVATGGTAPYTYLWNNGATTSSLSGLSQGSYQCTVTDAQGCNQTDYAYIQQAVNINFNSTVTNATCVQTNGSFIGFTTGGTGPYTYLWNNGATTQSLSGLTGGQSYQGIITDANGCTGNGYVYVGTNTPITVTYASSASSCTAATGSSALTINGGTAPYSVNWNTSPASSGVSVSGLPAGNYGFTVTDAVGCARTGVAVIPSVSTLNANLSTSSMLCPATTANITMNVIGTSTPFTYVWNTGSTATSLSNVPAGIYQCTVTDAIGCKITKGTSLQQTSTISLGVGSTAASCLYTADGTAYANATGGTAPYAYSWSNGQNTQTATGLATGYYNVNVTDANGCTFTSYYNNQVFVGYNASNNSCYCTISGVVYNDANGNCTQDVGENGIGNIMIHCSGSGYAYTNANGVYSFKVPTGSYTITQSVNANYPLTGCQTNNQTVSVTAATNCTTAVNFANTVIPVHDLHIITTHVGAPPIPGNPYIQKVIVQNDGTVTENNAQLGYVHDGQLTYNSATPVAFTQQNASTYPNWYSVTSGFPVLTSGDAATTNLNYSVPTNIPLNTQLTFFDTVAHAAPISTVWLTDNTPWNNVNTYQPVVVGSYDPNYKEVSPKGTGFTGNILQTDSVLNYVIHFQNEGTYFAQNIFILDALDADLDWTSLRPGYSDYNYTATISETGIVKFDFKNINLPWKSAYGDIMSSGMVSYSIKLKKNLAVGTQIQNTAGIYFDYNEPVITNTTLNTISAPVSVAELGKTDQNEMSLYPNPAQSDFTIRVKSLKKVETALSIIDINGRVVSYKQITLQEGENIIAETSAGLQSGVYFVQLKNNNQMITKKLVVTK